MFQTIGNEMNQTKGDEEEMSELIDLAKLVQIFLTIETVTPAKKSQLVRYSKAAILIQHSVFFLIKYSGFNVGHQKLFSAGVFIRYKTKKTHR